MAGSTDKPKRSHHKKQPASVPVALSDSDLLESTAGFFMFLGAGAEMGNRPVTAVILGAPQLDMDTMEVTSPRAEHNALALVKASQKNKYLRRVLVVINGVMAGGEAAKVGVDLLVASAVDSNVLPLDSAPVKFTIGKEIPKEIYEAAAELAALEKQAETEQHAPSAAA